MDTFQNLFSPVWNNLHFQSILSSFDYLKTISPFDIIDIFIVAYVIFRAIKLLKDTSAARLAKGVIVLVFVLLLSTALQFTTISYILRQSLSIGVFALIVIFQPELRRLLEQLGKGSLSRFFLSNDIPGETEAAIKATVAACTDMSKTKTGVLMVFERHDRLGEIVSTGTLVDAVPSPELLKNIFFKNSPLHDGALIIREGRICAAGCVLPLSGNQNLSRDLGTRHRAAVGMSELADSVLVVVSEETGSISVAIGGMLKRHLSPDVLKKVLESELMNRGEKTDKSRIAALKNIWKGGNNKS